MKTKYNITEKLNTENIGEAVVSDVYFSSTNRDSEPIYLLVEIESGSIYAILESEIRLQ
jgi:hypothetical protein